MQQSIIAIPVLPKKFVLLSVRGIEKKIVKGLEAQREMRDIIKALRIEINGLKAMKVKLVSINESLEAELRMLRAIVDSKMSKR